MKTLTELKKEVINRASYKDYTEAGIKKILGFLLIQDVENEIKEKYPLTNNNYLANCETERQREKEFYFLVVDFARLRDGIESIPATAANVKYYFTKDQLIDNKIDLSCIGKESWFIKRKLGVSVGITLLSSIYANYKYNDEFSIFLINNLCYIKDYQCYELYKHRDLIVHDILNEFNNIYIIKEFTKLSNNQKVKCIMRKDSEKIEMQDAENQTFLNPFNFKEFKEKILIPDYEKIKTCDDVKLLNDIIYKSELNEIYLKKLSYCYITYYKDFKDATFNIRIHYKNGYYDLLIMNDGIYNYYNNTLYKIHLHEIIEGEKTRNTIKKLIKIVYGYEVIKRYEV